MPAVKASPGQATATADFATVTVSTPVWLHWVRIAAAQTQLARAAANQWPQGTLPDEMHPAMIAITATAHALDGLYDQLKFVAPHVKGRPKRQRLILETLKRGFKLGKKGHQWLSEFDWLDDLRDPAVHPEQKHGPTIKHPRWGNVAAEYAAYSAEAAKDALDLLRDVLRTCADHPRPLTHGWADQQKDGILKELGW